MRQVVVGLHCAGLLRIDGYDARTLQDFEGLCSREVFTSTPQPECICRPRATHFMAVAESAS